MYSFQVEWNIFLCLLELQDVLLNFHSIILARLHFSWKVPGLSSFIFIVVFPSLTELYPVNCLQLCWSFLPLIESAFEVLQGNFRCRYWIQPCDLFAAFYNFLFSPSEYLVLMYVTPVSIVISTIFNFNFLSLLNMFVWSFTLFALYMSAHLIT